MLVEVTDQNICPVSLESYESLRESHSLVCTPCGHLFRDMDLMQWVTISQTCPLCRSVVRLDDIHYGEAPKRNILAKIKTLFNSIFCCHNLTHPY